jgi:two-component system, cell cycle response regulator
VLNERLDEEIQRSRRFGQSFSLLMLDIDFFKKINDSYGHPFGDRVLQALARLLRAQMREIDLAARYGGEEFVLLLPATDASGARLVAERVRETIAENAFCLPDGARVPVTVSIGVATYPDSADSAAFLIACADHALYTAKHSGRNRVSLYRDTLKAEINGNPQRVAELLNQNPEHLSAIVAAVDMKAPYLRDHTTCVERLALEFGKALDLSASERETLVLAARIHDIGMVMVPDAVLSKPQLLSEHEWSLLREHPVTAAAILMQVPALAHLAPVVRAHHERYDGSGYPDGLQAEATPFLARALALADAYCALTAQRAWRRALNLQEARAVIAAGRGLQFDPALADVFIHLLETRGVGQPGN